MVKLIHIENDIFNYAYIYIFIILHPTKVRIIISIRISLLMEIYEYTSTPPFCSLQWRYNEHDGVSNHQRLYCLLNRLFRHRSKKILKLRVTDICEGNSPHKRPVTRKLFPFDDVIMLMWFYFIQFARNDEIKITIYHIIRLTMTPFQYQDFPGDDFLIIRVRRSSNGVALQWQL